MTLTGLVITIIVLVADWIIYKKMGREGWEGIVPIYNLYVLCEELYKSGWRFLLLLIPIYNIFFVFKLMIDWAKGFNRSSGFGVGMVFFPYIFAAILAFGDSKWLDGSKANNSEDFVYRTVEKAKEATSGLAKDDKAIEKLEQLKELLDKGIITQEEYDQKREELLKRI